MPMNVRSFGFKIDIEAKIPGERIPFHSNSDLMISGNHRGPECFVARRSRVARLVSAGARCDADGLPAGPGESHASFCLRGMQSPIDARFPSLPSPTEIPHRLLGSGRKWRRNCRWRRPIPIRIREVYLRGPLLHIEGCLIKNETSCGAGVCLPAFRGPVSYLFRGTACLDLPIFIPFPSLFLFQLRIVPKNPLLVERQPAR
jgi:hypothetical protein